MNDKKSFLLGALVGWLLFTKQGKEFGDVIAAKASGFFGDMIKEKEQKHENEKTV